MLGAGHGRQGRSPPIGAMRRCACPRAKGSDVKDEKRGKGVKAQVRSSARSCSIALATSTALRSRRSSCEPLCITHYVWSLCAGAARAPEQLTRPQARHRPQQDQQMRLWATLRPCTREQFALVGEAPLLVVLGATLDMAARSPPPLA